MELGKSYDIWLNRQPLRKEHPWWEAVPLNAPREIHSHWPAGHVKRTEYGAWRLRSFVNGMSVLELIEAMKVIIDSREFCANDFRRIARLSKEEIEAEVVMHKLRKL